MYIRVLLPQSLKSLIKNNYYNTLVESVNKNILLRLAELVSSKSFRKKLGQVVRLLSMSGPPAVPPLEGSAAACCSSLGTRESELHKAGKAFLSHNPTL